MLRACKVCKIPKELNADNFQPFSRKQWRKQKNDGRFRWRCKACEYKAHTTYIRKKPEKVLYYDAKMRAKRDNLPFAIKESDIVIPEICPILGHKLEQGTRESHEWAPSLDKKIPELGYTPDNIQVISHRANRLKSDATLEELKLVVAFLERAETGCTQPTV